MEYKVSFDEVDEHQAREKWREFQRAHNTFAMKMGLFSANSFLAERNSLKNMS